MATLYVDFEGGNDNYGGSSFALLASGADGAITSTTFSSATASFPNDGSLINQYLSIFNGSIYAVYQITAWVSSTSLTIARLGTYGTALADTSARQYYIGGRWKTTTNGATSVRVTTGDTVRIMASPDPTSMGNGTWTSAPRSASVNISSSTNATPIVITTAAAHGLTTGDYVSIANHTTNTNANGTWKVGTTPTSTTFQILQINGANTTGNGVGGATGTASKFNYATVKFASAPVQNIALCGGLGQKPAWTASANVTCTQNTTAYKEGYSSASIAIAAAFTTGKAAYYTLPSTLDLSGYQQVSFWVQQTVGTIGAAGAVYIALCTDTLGATVAHTCNIPALGTTGVWMPVTVDLGTNLNSAIRSVALYIVTDNGAQTFLIDNIVACKAASSADSISLVSLISQNTGTEAWYPLQSLNTDIAVIANINGTLPTITLRGYYGTGGTFTTYKRETIKTTPLASILNTANNFNTSGTQFSGGWNRTNMSTQTGVTWVDGQNGVGIGYSGSGSVFAGTPCDTLGAARYGTGFSGVNGGDNLYATACSTGMSLCGSSGSSSISWWANNNNQGSDVVSSGSIYATSSITSGISLNSQGTSVQRNTSGKYVLASNNGADGIRMSTSPSFTTNVTIQSFTAEYNAGTGVNNGNAINTVIGNGVTTGNSVGVAISNTNVYYASISGNNVTINEVTEFTNNGSGLGSFSRVDNTNNNSWVYYYGLGTINQQNSVFEAPATTAWKMSPTSTSATVLTPIRLKLATAVCAAGSLVTVTARMQRSDTGLTMRLVCPGGQIGGGAADVFTDMTAAANTWETVTITFTPTYAGGIDIYAYAFGGTTYSGYVCNLTVSQA